MWELDHKEGWALKNWCFWTMVLEKTLESPLDSKEIKPGNHTRNQSWIFIGRTDPEAEVPILWPPDAKNWLIRKDPDAGKDSRREKKGTTEDEIVGWHHRLDEYEFEQASGDGEGQGNLAWCSSWGCKESDMTEWLKSSNFGETPKGCLCICVPRELLLKKASILPLLIMSVMKYQSLCQDSTLPCSQRHHTQSQSGLCNKQKWR